MNYTINNAEWTQDDPRRFNTVEEGGAVFEPNPILRKRQRWLRRKLTDANKAIDQKKNG